MHHMLRDLRHSVRSLVRTPALTVTIVSTVGLGIGATTAIFSVINAVLIEPLPYADSDRLVRIYTLSPPNNWPLLGGESVWRATVLAQRRRGGGGNGDNIHFVCSPNDFDERHTTCDDGRSAAPTP